VLQLIVLLADPDDPKQTYLAYTRRNNRETWNVEKPIGGFPGVGPNLARSDDDPELRGAVYAKAGAALR
jgi:hypothetical protein